MKKYPVIYKNKEYEVRWHNGSCIDTISVYEVRPQKFFKYKELATYYTCAINELYDLKLNDENLYVDQAMFAVIRTLQEIEEENRKKILKESQKQKLEKWNGVVE